MCLTSYNYRQKLLYPSTCVFPVNIFLKFKDINLKEERLKDYCLQEQFLEIHGNLIYIKMIKP